jgi:hypothetical protein
MLLRAELTSFDSLLPALTRKFGYDNPEEFKQQAQNTFSLVETGIVEQESTRLLLINVRLHPPPLSTPFTSHMLTAADASTGCK